MGVDKSQQRIRRMFGQISPRYDLLNHLLSGGTDYYWRWRTVRTVPPRGEGPILDVCCGTGDLAIAYWKKGRKRLPVVGADFTHEMLERANRKVARFRVSASDHGGVTFLEADTLRLPFAEDRFQIVSVAFGLRNVADAREGLREMTRVCAPGGRVVVLEFSMPTNRLIRACYGWYFRKVLPRIGKLLSRDRESASAYDYLPQSVEDFPQGERLAGMMEECGLRGVRRRSLTFGVVTLYWGEKPPGQ